MSSLSLKKQYYIETIHHLCEVHGHAHTKAIAEELKIRMASATEVIQSLDSAGFVNYNKRQGKSSIRAYHFVDFGKLLLRLTLFF